MRSSSSLALVVLCGALAGCGNESTHELPPAAGPPRSPPTVASPAGQLERIGRRPVLHPGGTARYDGGRRVVVVAPRARVLESYDTRTHRRLARVPAGVGPTHVACLDRGPCFVVDTAGDALLVFAVAPSLELVRRVYLRGGPYGIALDVARRRLWVTVPGRDALVELPAHGRPHVLASFATVRQPDGVAVDQRTGVVTVTARTGGLLERLRS